MSAHTHHASAAPPRPLPLISVVPSDDGRPDLFTIGDEALSFLSLLRMPVAPIAVVGKYRTGKSFLLNRLLQRRNGFEVGPTVEACTKGIWIWSEPVMIKQDGQDVAVLVLDTEGIGAATSSAEHDARIFALATLLSSLMIYNSVGAIDEEAIQSLAFVANLTKHIQFRSGSGAERGVAAAAPLQDAASDISGSSSDEDSDDDDGAGPVATSSYVATLRRDMRKRRAAAKRMHATRLLEERRRMPGARGSNGDGDANTDAELSTFFPTFVWVLRDFALELVDEAGQPLTAKDYLELCLSPATGFSSETTARNRTRRVLTAFFKDRDCVTLVRPLEDEARLQQMDTVPDKELRPQFRRELRALRTHVFNDLVKPKTMHGQLVTGRMLAGLARAYVDAMNADAVPSLGNAWDGVTRIECKDALDASIKLYRDAVAEDLPSSVLPLDEDELKCRFEIHRIAAMSAFDERAVGPTTERYKKELHTTLSGELRELLAANAVSSELACNRLIAHLWREHMEPLLAIDASVDGATIVAADVSSPEATAKLPRQRGTANSSRRRLRDASTEPMTLDIRSTNNLVTPSAPVVAMAYDPERFTDALAAFRAVYFAEARGPAIHRVLASFLLDVVPVVARAVDFSRAVRDGRSTEELRERMAEVEKASAAAMGRSTVLDEQLASLRAEREDAVVALARVTAQASLDNDKLTTLASHVAAIRRERDDAVVALKAERVALAARRLGLPATAGDEGPQPHTSLTTRISGNALRSAQNNLDVANALRPPRHSGTAAANVASGARRQRSGRRKDSDASSDDRRSGSQIEGSESDRRYRMSPRAMRRQPDYDARSGRQTTKRPGVAVSSSEMQRSGVHSDGARQTTATEITFPPPAVSSGCASTCCIQ